MKSIATQPHRVSLWGAVIGVLILTLASASLIWGGGLVHAQDDPIEYPEDGTDPVATFTATDPEEKDIDWTLDGVDAGDFKIDGGVLTFASQPDFENPADANTDNEYTVIVEASAGASDVTAVKTVTHEVTVNVTNVEEAGSIMLSTLQPQVGVEVIATLSDADTRAADGNTETISPTWQWYRGSTEIPGATAASFTPSSGDVGFLLVVKASYDDAEGDDKSAEQTSAHPVRSAPASNIAPVFPDEAVGNDAVLIMPREVDENTASGENIGAPIAATDPGDVLTYAFEGSTNNAAEGSFDIDRATGQLMTKAALNHEDAASYTVTVTATDPFGVPASAEVTIQVADVNEAPTIDDSPAAAESFAENGDVATAVEDYAATDQDDGEEATLAWSKKGADAGKFSITSGAGVLTFTASPNYESPGDADGDNDYEVTVVVTDADGNTDEHDVTVSVTNVEEDGTVTISTLQPRVGVELTAMLEDPDGDITGLMWQWYRATTINLGSLPTAECEEATDNNCSIKDATSAAYIPTSGDQGEMLTAVATYKDGAGTEADTESGEAAAEVITDRRPKAPEFPDQDMETEGDQTDQKKTVDENTASGQPIDDGNPVVATDPNPGDMLTYTLGGTDAASFGIADGTGQLQTKAALDHEKKDSYSVTVTATDSLNLTATVNVTIEVNDVDEVPDLDGDSSAMYVENGDGSVATYTATDPEDKDIVWTLVGNDDDDFSIVGGVLKFNSKPDYETPGDTGTDNEYAVTVQASAGASDDAAIKTATLAVTVTVTNMDEPGSIVLSTLQPQVGQQVTATLSDEDVVTNTSITWRWYRGSTEISGVSTTQSVTANYTPMEGDVGNRLRARATYDDDEGEDKSAQADSSRSIRRAPSSNTAPMFPDQDLGTDLSQTGQDREVAENTPAGRNIGAPVVATDSGDVLTYSLGGTGAALFEINRATGQLSTKAALDHEASGGDEHTVDVTATDPFGESATAEVTIEVTDVNEDPAIGGDPAAAISFAEINPTTPLPTYTATDQDVGEEATLEWSTKGADAGEFDISGGGVLTFSSTPDYESPGDANRDNDYKVTIVVTDTEGNTDEHDVTVSVTNVEETGTVTLSTLQPRVGVELTAMLEDPDGGITGLMWQWSKGGADIEDATSASYTPVADDIGATLTATATYKDGAGTDANTADEDAANTAIADTRNKAPKFPDQDDETEGDQTDQKREIPEGTAAAQNIGDPVTATDKQFETTSSATSVDDTLTYTLGGTDAASFDIMASSGQLQTKAALDHEDKDSYTVTVTATDPSSLSATVTVTIEVTDVDEAPMIMVGGLAISGDRSVEVEEGNTAVATYTAAGPDEASAMWDLSGDDAGDFSISSGGELAFMSAPDFENPADMDEDNVYQVTVEADDGTYMDTQDVTVTVTNVEEGAGSVTLSAMQPQVGVELTAMVSDPDGATSVTWQWAREDDQGAYVDIAGAMSAGYTPVDDDVGKHLRATVTYTDSVGPGKTGMEISAEPVAPSAPSDLLLAKYDNNPQDGRINREEVLDGIDAFFLNPSSALREEVLDLIDRFFEDLLGS